MTIKEANHVLKQKLIQYYDSRETSAIIDLVLEDLTGFNRVDRIIHDQDILTALQQLQLKCAIKYLEMNMPVQYILGYAYFADMKLKVNNQVLIPRPETEELVDWVAEAIANHSDTSSQERSLLDIGTGSGCIPLALKKRFPFLQTAGGDISDGALGVARHNARLLGLDVSFSKLDILDKDVEHQLGGHDYIISNPPYIGQDERGQMEAHVLDYEPHLALFPENDLPATIFYKKISQVARKKLKPGGYLFFEINPDYVNEIIQMLTSLGFSDIKLKEDLQGRPRMVNCLLKK